MRNNMRFVAIFLIVTVIFGGIIFFNRILSADVFNKEEAQHAAYGLWLYKDMRAFDLASFWQDTQRQIYWPFLHSWALATTFLIFGVSYLSARLLSLIIFIATLYLMYLVAFHVSDTAGEKIGILSVILALTCPMMVKYSSVCTLEGLGALVFLASFYFYAVCEERNEVYEYLILGFLIGLSIYTNYLYAYLMIPAYLIVTLVKLGPLFFEGTSLRRRGEKEAMHFFWWAYKKLIILVVLMLLAAAWFLQPAFIRKVMLFQQAVFRFSGGEMPLSLWQNLTYYLKAIIFDYSFSPVLGMLILASIFMPFTARHYNKVNKLYTLIWVILLLATLTVPTKAPQLIYIIAPLLFLKFSAVVFYFLDKNKRYAAAISLVIILPTLISLPVLENLYFPPRPAERTQDVLNYFRVNTPDQQPLAVSINAQHLSPEEIAFHFWDWKARVSADPTAGEEELFGEGKYLLAIELDPSSRYQEEMLDDSSTRWNYFLSGKLKAGEIREYSARRFETLGLTAKIYERNAD